MAINKVFLCGNVGADPEISTTQSGARLARFRLATTEKWRDKGSGQDKEATEWHSVVAFGDGLVDKVIEPNVKKGAKVTILGKLRTRKWQAQDGSDRWSTEVVVDFGGSIEIAGSGRAGPPPPSGQDDYGSAPATRSSAPPSGDELDDDIPF
ncbi:MAG: single-stranded DNA-binding protein [Pseudomonadota bacterium]